MSAKYRHSLSEFYQTRHFEEREQQRGIRHADLQLVLDYGERVSDGYVMSNKARRKAIDSLRKAGDKRAIQHLDHLKNVAVIEQEGRLVTVYRASGKKLKKMRSARCSRQAR